MIKLYTQKEVYKPFYFKTLSVSLSVISTKKIKTTIRKNKAKNCSGAIGGF